MNAIIKYSFTFFCFIFSVTACHTNTLKSDKEVKKDIKHCSRDIKNYSLDEEPCYFGFVTEDDYVRPTQSKKWAEQCIAEQKKNPNPDEPCYPSENAERDAKLYAIAICLGLQDVQYLKD